MTGRSILAVNPDSPASEPFTKVLCLLDWSKDLSVEVFRKMRQGLAGSFWINTQRYVSTHGVINSEGIYEMFGGYSLTNGGDVRCGLIDWICECKEEINEYVKIVLQD